MVGDRRLPLLCGILEQGIIGCVCLLSNFHGVRQRVPVVETSLGSDTGGDWIDAIRWRPFQRCRFFREMDHTVVVDKGLGISWHTLGITYVGHVAHLHCLSQHIGCSSTFIRHLVSLHPLLIHPSFSPFIPTSTCVFAVILSLFHALVLPRGFTIFLDELIGTTLFITHFFDVADVFIDRRVDVRLWTFIECGCGRGRGRIDKIFHGTH